MISCSGLYEQFKTGWGDPRHGQWCTMFAEGLCSDLPRWTASQMATRPPCSAFVALTVWQGGAWKLCSHCLSSLLITMCCHEFTPLSLIQWPLAMLWFSFQANCFPLCRALVKENVTIKWQELTDTSAEGKPAKQKLSTTREQPLSSYCL